MEKLAGDLLLGLKFVRLEILSTSFIDFLYEEFGELRSRSLGPKGLTGYITWVIGTWRTRAVCYAGRSLPGMVDGRSGVERQR